MFIFLTTLVFYNCALFYCYRTNNDFVINLVFAAILNGAYFYMLPELVEFVESADKRQMLLLCMRGLCVISFCAMVCAMLLFK